MSQASQTSLAGRVRSAIDAALNPYSSVGRRMRSRGRWNPRTSSKSMFGKTRVAFKKQPKIEPVDSSEYKYIDLNYSNVEVAGDAANTACYISDVDEGTTSITRIGKKIRAISVEGIIQVAPVTQTLVSGQWIDAILVVDKQGGRTVANTDVWTAAYRSLRKVDSTDFTILKKWSVYCPRGSNETLSGAKAIKFFYRFPKDTIVRYDTNNGQAADCSANALWLMFQTSNAAVTLAANDGVNTHSELRLRFSDA